MGWVHDLTRREEDTAYVRSRRINARPVDSKPPNVADWSAFAAACQQALPGPALDFLASSLGVSSDSLAGLWTGWSQSHGAYTFPMLDEWSRIVGIRLRRPDGFKWAVEGSRNGIFHLWRPGDSKAPIAVCEGPTDAAALWDIGFWTIGRAACRTNGDEIAAVFARWKRPCIIVSDNDGPGIEGAHALADRLARTVTVRVIVPPWAKDGREWVSKGATFSTVMNLAEHQRPWEPRKD